MAEGGMDTISDDVQDEDSILYDISCQVDWPVEKDVVGGAQQDEIPPGIIYTNVKRIQSSISRWTWATARAVGFPVRTGAPCLLPPDLIKLIYSQPSWIFTRSPDGNFIAVLQDACLEIRSLKEDYNTLVGRCTFSKDLYSQWRKVEWSQYSTMVAFSDSDGTVHICDLRGILLFSFHERVTELEGAFDYSSAISSLVFIGNETTKNKDDSVHLLIVSYSGAAVCLEINNTHENGYKVMFAFDFSPSHTMGVSCVLYHKEHSMIIVGGCTGYAVDAEGVPKATKYGLTAWRLLSDVPFLKSLDVFLEADDTRRKVGFLRRLSTVPSGFGKKFKRQTLDGVYTMALSPSSNYLSTVHFSGALTIWEIPSFRRKRSWRKEEQPFFGEIYSEGSKLLNSSKKLKDYPLLHNATDCKWWSESAVILARCSGSLTVARVTGHSLENLFGNQCEWLEPAPRVSFCRDEGFLALECETQVKALKQQRIDSSEEAQKEEDNEYDPFLDDSDGEESPGVSGRLKNYIKSSMYNLTEMEYYRPPRKRPKLMTKSYRLISITKTTPEKLFEKKLEDEEYGEALALAQRYNLDGDRVFQRQWQKSPVSVASIQDYLSKVTKRSWVMHECCNRVPKELDAARELLKFGLRVTDMDEIARKADLGSKNLSDSDSDYEEEYEGFDIEEQRQQEIRQRDKFTKKWSRHIDFGHLTLHQKEMIRARKKIIKYLDRLSTYEYLLGGYDAARERYNRDRFVTFRQEDMLTSALEYARNCDWKAVDTLLTFHGNELREHRLPILSNFPKTLSPIEYRSLLPVLNHDDNVTVWPEVKHRDPEDWSEKEEYQHASTPLILPVDPFSEFYRRNPELLQFRTATPSAALIKNWFLQQATHMDLDARDIEGALDLLAIGAENGVQGLESLTREFKTLEMLVYECDYDPGLTLAQLQKKSRLEQLKMLMKMSSKEMYIKNFHRWGIPFLKSSNNVEPACKIFEKYVLDMAEDDLALPCLIFTSFLQDHSMPVVITSLENLVKLSLESVYLNCHPEQLNLVKQIHAVLGKVDRGILRGMPEGTSDMITRLESHVYICSMLASHNVKITPSDVREVESDRLKVQKLLIRLSRSEGAREPPLNKMEWNYLLRDMLQLRDRIFSETCGLEAAVCLEVFVESLLTSGSINNFKIAGERMMRTAEEEHEASRRRLYPALQKLSYESSVALVIKSSQEYFDASTPTSNDNMLSLARECLLLITDRPPLIRGKLDLIEGVVLLQRFGVDKLPLQVRLTEDRLSLVKKAIDAQNEAYRKTESLLRLAMLLQVCGSDKQERKGQVLTMIVDKALTCHDLDTAYCLCQELISMPYTPSWEVCLKLASCIDFQNLVGKRDILCFVACYCDETRLSEVMEQLCVQNFTILQREHEALESENEDINTCSPTLPRSFESLSEKGENPLTKLVSTSSEFLSPSKMLETTALGTKAMLSATGNVLSATSHTTKVVLSNVGNTEWWKKSIDKTLSIIPMAENQDVEDDVLLKDISNSDLEYHGCPEFYSDMIEKSISKYELFVSHQSFILPPTIALKQAKFRALQLKQFVTETDSEENDVSILKDLVEDILPYDFALGLAYLFAFSNSADAYEILQKFPISALSIQMGLYYFSLLFLHSSVNCIQPDAKSPLYEIPPMDLIKHALTEAASFECETDSHMKTIARYLIQLREQMYDFSQGEKLQKLGRGIDLGRFTKDSEYREETILGLAMTADEEQYKLAVSLAHRSGTDLWLVLMTHLEYLFTECQEQLDCMALHNRIKTLNMVPELVTRPEEFFKRMDKYIFPFIGAQDHERLLLYFSLLSECKFDGKSFESTHGLCSITPIEHVKMLRKIRSATPTLDYKALITDKFGAIANITPSESVLQILRPVLDASNVPMFAKMMPKISYRDFTISASSLYLEVAKGIVWKGISQDMDQMFDAVSRYESCSNFLRMCYPNDLLQFFQEFLFSSNYSKLLTQTQRQDLIKRGVKLCKIQGTKERKNQLDESILQNGQSFHTILPKFIQMSKHLDSYSTTFISNLVTKSKDDDNVKKYLGLYDQSQSNPEKIIDLAVVMLCDGCSPTFIQSFLAVVPGNKWTCGNVLQKCIDDVIKDFAASDDKVSVFDLLSVIVKTISQHEKERGKIFTSKQVIELLRPFCSDTNIDVNVRVDVLQLLEDQFELEDSEAELLLLHRTCAIVRDGWGEAVCDKFVNSDAGTSGITEDTSRFEVFQNLLSSERADVAKLSHLVTLLTIWPKFTKTEMQDQCWHKLFLKFTTLGPDGGKEIVEVVRKSKSEICTQTIRDVFHKLLDINLSFFAIKLALLTYTPDIRNELIGAIKNVTQMGPSQCDEELIRLMLEKSIAVDTVQTLYYERITEYLLSGECLNAEEHIHRLARQLQDRGHMPEAGTLLLNFRGTHPALRTFGNALSSLTRWLHS